MTSIFCKENQLKAIDLDNDGTEDIEFGYDFAGQRLWRKKNGVLTGIWIGGVYEYKDPDADGTGIALCHVHSEVGLIASFEPDPTEDSVFYYYHSDHLGSSSVVTNRSGDIQKHYGYSVFGDDRYDDADYSANMAPSNRYTGQVLDEDTGLYYYNARYYDPLLARFIQADTVLPSLTSQGLNRYTYSYNNPLKFIDPSGNMPTYNFGSSANFDFSWSSISSYASSGSWSSISSYSSYDSGYMSGSSYSGAGALSQSVTGTNSNATYSSMYSPSLGLGYSTGMNWNAYCANNPVNFADPWGLCGQQAEKEWNDVVDRAWGVCLDETGGPYVFGEYFGYDDPQQCDDKAQRIVDELKKQNYKFWNFNVETRQKIPLLVGPDVVPYNPKGFVDVLTDPMLMPGMGINPWAFIPKKAIMPAIEFLNGNMSGCGIGVPINHSMAVGQPQNGNPLNARTMDNFQWWGPGLWQSPFPYLNTGDYEDFKSAYPWNDGGALIEKVN